MNPRLKSAGPPEQVPDRSNARLRLLAEIANSLLMAEDPREIIRGIFSKLSAHLGLEIYSNYLVMEDGSRLRLDCWGGVSDEEAERVRFLEFGQGVCGKVASRRERIVCEDVQGGGAGDAVVREAGATAYACFPLVSGGRVLGTLSFGTRSRPFFLEDELDLMQTVADQAAVAVERRRAYDELRRRGAELEERAHLLDLAHVFVQDFDGAILFWDRGAQKMYGWSQEEALGRNAQELLRTEFPQPVAEVRRMVKEQGSWVGELVQTRRDGSQVVVASHWLLHRGGGDRPDVILEVSNDITGLREIEAALRESEERYRALAEFLPVLVYTANREGERDFVNQRWCAYTGLDTGEGLGRQWLAIVHPDDREAVERSWEEATAGGTVFEAQYRVRAKDGSYRWFLSRSQPLRDGKGRIRKWFGTAMDIEDHKRMEEAVRRAQKAESIGVLAGGIAHRFNNLLTGILGGASVAMDSLPQESEARPLLEGVIESSQKAAELTSQLLAYAGKGRYVEEKVNLSAVVDGLKDLLETGISRKVDLRLELRRDLPPVTADAGQMRQVVLGLVMNAAEAVGEGTGTVRVKTGTARVKGPLQGNVTDQLPPGEYACLEVRDDGCGMDAATMARIFDPFFTTKFMGRGLGLPAALGIVRAQKGAIQYESSQGQGSTFRVLLPLKAAAEGRPSEARDRTVVLVVDDEQIVRVTARAILERAGYRVLPVENGVEALDLLVKSGDEVGLVLLDMAMPLMSGEEVMRQIRQLRPDLPVLVSTGYDEGEALRRFAGQTVAGFVQKPFTARQLVEKVTGALAGGAGAPPAGAGD